MQCPFCLGDIPDTAVACQHCGRDVPFLKPIVERISRLESQVADLREAVVASVPRSRPATASTMFWGIVLPVLLALGVVWLKTTDRSGDLRLYYVLAPMAVAASGFFCAWRRGPMVLWKYAVAGAIAGLLPFFGSFAIWLIKVNSISVTLWEYLSLGWQSGVLHVISGAVAFVAGGFLGGLADTLSARDVPSLLARRQAVARLLRLPPSARSDSAIRLRIAVLDAVATVLSGSAAGAIVSAVLAAASRGSG